VAIEPFALVTVNVGECVVCGESEKLPQRSCHTAINLVIIAKSHRPVIDIVIIIAMTDAIAITGTIIIAKSHRPVIDVAIIIDIFVVMIIIDIVVDGPLKHFLG
jgi:hypothetical protein